MVISNTLTGMMLMRASFETEGEHPMITERCKHSMIPGRCEHSMIPGRCEHSMTW